MTNPYDRNNYKGKFEITHVGYDDDYYVYRIWFDGHHPMDTLMLEKEIFNWAFENTKDDYFMGNDYTNDSAPNISKYLAETLGNNTLIMFKNVEDAELFENEYPITGISQQMLK